MREIDGDVHVLLIRDPYQNWGLPKGHLKEGEDTPSAALREVTEETGLETLELGPEVTEIDWYFKRRGRLVHKFCTFFLMRSIRGMTVPEVAEGITECVWLPLEEALERISYGNARGTLREAVVLLEREEPTFS